MQYKCFYVQKTNLFRHFVCEHLSSVEANRIYSKQTTDYRNPPPEEWLRR